MKLKHILIGALLSLSLLGSAQNNPYNPYQKDKISKGTKSFAMDVAWITLDAMGDAYMDTNRKELGHFLNAASTGILLSEALVIDFDKDDWQWKIPATILLRFAIFDPIYNVTSGLPIYYIGSTSVYDNVLTKLNAPQGSLWFPRTICFTVAISLNSVYSK